MKKYLVVFECPCIGTNEELVQFLTDKDVSDWAWATSVKTREYVTGSYEIYRLFYNPQTHLHELAFVNEIEIWEAEAK